MWSGYHRWVLRLLTLALALIWKQVWGKSSTCMTCVLFHSPLCRVPNTCEVTTVHICGWLPKWLSNSVILRTEVQVPNTCWPLKIHRTPVRWGHQGVRESMWVWREGREKGILFLLPSFQSSSSRRKQGSAWNILLASKTLKEKASQIS